MSNYWAPFSSGSPVKIPGVKGTGIVQGKVKPAAATKNVQKIPKQKGKRFTQ